MMRYVVVAAWLAGCASGSRFGPGDGRGSNAPDAHEFLDAKVHPDAPIDAPRRPDAFVPPDAAIDAYVYHDAPTVDACTPHIHSQILNPAFDLTPMGTSWQQ